MRVRQEDHEYEAETPEGIVAQMRDAAFEKARTSREYMQQAATRAQTMTGKSVRIDSAEHFVEDLIGCGLLRSVA